MYVCMYVCMYIYIPTHTKIHTTCAYAYIHDIFIVNTWTT